MLIWWLRDTPRGSVKARPLTPASGGLHHFTLVSRRCSAAPARCSTRACALQDVRIQRVDDSLRCR